MASITTASKRKADAATMTRPRRRGIHINPFRIFIYVILTLGAILFVMPFLWMVSTSLQDRGDIVRGKFIPSLQFISVTKVTNEDLERNIQDYLDAGEHPPYLENVRSQIEDSRRQRGFSVHEYLRTQKFGYADVDMNIDIPLINQIWSAKGKYVVVGGAAHYLEAWDESNFSKYFFNSVKVAGLTILAQTVTSVLAAYAFARIEFPGSNLLFSIFLATIFIPTMVVLIPNRNTVTNIDKFFTEDFPEKQNEWGITSARQSVRDGVYFVVDKAHAVADAIGLADALNWDKPAKLGEPEPFAWKWMDSWPALVFPFLASTFSIFLLRQFFIQIPNELWDAARIDGAGHFRFLFQVVVPISRAALVTVVIFTFIGTWNALEWPLLVTFTDNWRPISYGLFAFQTEAGQNLNLLMAGSVITLIPVLIIYLFAQKQFTEGIATSGLKG